MFSASKLTSMQLLKAELHRSQHLRGWNAVRGRQREEALWSIAAKNIQPLNVSAGGKDSCTIATFQH